MQITLASISPRRSKSKSEPTDQLVHDYVTRSTRWPSSVAIVPDLIKKFASRVASANNALYFSVWAAAYF